jgi:hypothetical protein
MFEDQAEDVADKLAIHGAFMADSEFMAWKAGAGAADAVPVCMKQVKNAVKGWV